MGRGRRTFLRKGGTPPRLSFPSQTCQRGSHPPSSSPKTFVFIEFPMAVLPVEEESAFPVFVRERRFLLAWIVFLSQGIHSLVFFELCTVQSVILKGEPALYLSTLPKRGKARNRDSIRSKVLGRGGMGVRGKGGETFLQKGFPSLPPIFPYCILLIGEP